MPKEIFNALELAALKSAYQGKEITAQVPKHLYDSMIEKIENYNKSKNECSKNKGT